MAGGLPSWIVLLSWPEAWFSMSSKEKIRRSGIQQAVVDYLASPNHTTKTDTKPERRTFEGKFGCFPQSPLGMLSCFSSASPRNLGQVSYDP